MRPARGFVGIVIMLILLGGLAYFAYYAYTNFTKLPNALTKKTAKEIYRYPNATTWVEEDTKNFCFFATDGCAQPVRIYFETPNSWASIYDYYVSAMPQLGFKSNTNVVTSTPSTVVFDRSSDKCHVAMENHNEIKYSITVSCPESTRPIL